MQLLLTNDDGIDAPGLAALLDAVGLLGTPLIVAPKSPQSGSGHTVSDRTPLRVTPHRLSPPATPAHAVDGRPADCVRLGLRHYAPDAGWVIAGINSGGNLGVDVYSSGTVAAAREAAILGRPAVAVSQFVRDARTLDWRRSARWTSHVLRQIMALPCEPGVFWNVNLPQPAAGEPPTKVVFAPLAIDPLDVRYHRDQHPEDVSVFHYRGVYLERPRTGGTDVDAVFSDCIAITRLSLDSEARSGPPPAFSVPDDGDRSSR